MTNWKAICELIAAARDWHDGWERPPSQHNHYDNRLYEAIDNLSAVPDMLALLEEAREAIEEVERDDGGWCLWCGAHEDKSMHFPECKRQAILAKLPERQS